MSWSSVGHNVGELKLWSQQNVIMSIFGGRGSTDVRSVHRYYIRIQFFKHQLFLNNNELLTILRWNHHRNFRNPCRPVPVIAMIASLLLDSSGVLTGTWALFLLKVLDFLFSANSFEEFFHE